MSDVLIIDDSPADRALFRTLLRRDGFTVHEEASGRDAVAKALEVRPHVVVLDVNLPGIDGHAVCRALRADPRTAGLPVLMLTVRGNDVDVLAGLEAGADDYVAKDSAGEIFLARIRRLIRYRQMATLSVLNEQLTQIGRLLAGIVHEIRGPLSVIRGNAELLRLELGDGHAHHQWIDPIIRNSQILQVRLEHLMAAVRGGPAVLQPTEVVPLIREAADLFLKGTDPRGGKVTIETDFEDGIPPVQADAGRLFQVLLNLLANAHEAILGAGHDGRINVQARVERESGGDWLTIDLQDSGPGIPEAHIDRIFDPFYTTKAGGTGYGLYLASEILREHGGRLTARNVEGGGARFTIALPIEPSPPAEPTAGPVLGD